MQRCIVRGNFDNRIRRVSYADIGNERQVDDEVRIGRILLEILLTFVEVKTATLQGAEIPPPKCGKNFLNIFSDLHSN